MTVSKPLTVLMSAVSESWHDLSDDLIQYKFVQEMRIPSYLLAIVAADLVSK